MKLNYAERLEAQQKLNNSKMLEDYRESIAVATKGLEKNKNMLTKAKTIIEKEKIENKIGVYKSIIKELKETLKFLNNYYVTMSSKDNKYLVVSEQRQKYNINQIVSAYKSKKLSV